MKNVVYRIRNIANDRFYVGSTVDSRKRFWQHRKALRTGSHKCVPLQRAWDKYGEDFFKFEVLEHLPAPERLVAVEQWWLDEHFGKAHCYNLSGFADTPMRGASKALRERLSQATKKQWERSDPRTGKRHSEETKRRISGQVRRADAEGRGKRHHKVSEVTRKRMSEALKGNTCAKGHIRTDEHRAKLSAALKGNQNWLGKNHTKESKRKMSKGVIEVTSQLEFPSLTAALDYYDMTMPTLRRSLKTDRPISKGKLEGLWFRYLEVPLEKQ